MVETETDGLWPVLQLDSCPCHCFWTEIKVMKASVDQEAPINVSDCSYFQGLAVNVFGGAVRRSSLLLELETSLAGA